MTRPSTRTLMLLLLTGALLVTAFWISPWDGADDWETFYLAAKRLIAADTPLYGSLLSHSYFSNPPWVALSVAPLTILPPKFGWAVISAASLALALLVLRRWDVAAGWVKAAAVLGSPPMFYILLHGQIDMVVVSAVLLPAWTWPVAAITKPQVAIGLLVGVPRRQWLRAALFSGVALAISFVLWGFWPPALLGQATPFVGEGHNLWASLWPFQLPLGVLLVVAGLGRADERLLIAGSPFLSPYATFSTLIGPWIAAVSYLKAWQVAVVWLSWWGVVAYQAIK
jgi:hypothetical protein